MEILQACVLIAHSYSFVFVHTIDGGKSSPARSSCSSTNLQMGQVVVNTPPVVMALSCASSISRVYLK